MKLIYFFLFSTAVWIVQAQSLEQILTRNEKAGGGRTKMESFQAFQTCSRLEEFGSYVADTFFVSYQRGGKMAIEARIKPNVIFKEGIDGELRGSRPTQLNPERTLLAAHSTHCIVQFVGQIPSDQLSNFKRTAMT